MVSRSFARKMFGSESPIGRRVRSWRDENVLREIVGVVGDVKYSGLSERESVPARLCASAQCSWGLMLRRAQPDHATRHRRHAAAVVGRSTPRSLWPTCRRWRRRPAESIASQRYATLLLTVLAGVALTLSALGIYGVTSYVFTLRRREMGIRLALGASGRACTGWFFDTASR